MSIRQHIKYDSEKYSGYVDFRGEIINNSTSITKDSLVFLFVYINAAWKIPYPWDFFINGITAEK